MSHPDLNLLVTLDVLLAEGSVARAAERLRLSPSAMSRALARLRETTGDPLLVRAGRGLVPTPARARAARAGRPARPGRGSGAAPGRDSSTSAQLVRTFTLRTSEGFVENFGPALIARVGEEAPGVRLRFVPKPDKDSAPLRDGSVDLETGVVGKTTGPEVRAQALVPRPLHRRRARGASAERGRGHARPLCRRPAHPRLAAGPRQGADRRSLGAARAGTRQIVTMVGGFSAALALARGLRPDRQRSRAAHRKACAPACTAFPCRSPLPEITVSMLWHPRLDADPAHRWLRGVRSGCLLGAFARSSIVVELLIMQNVVILY